MSFRTHFPTARYVDPRTKAEQTVQLGLPVQPGNISYSDVSHKGHLKCMFCDAAMRVQDETISVAGSAAKGRDNFFKPVDKHDDTCRLSAAYKRAAGEAVKKPAVSRKAKNGFLLTINTMEHSDDFPVTEEGPFTISKGGRVIAVKDELKMLKRVNVTLPEDIIAFIDRYGDDADVAFRNVIQKLNKTFVQEKNPDDWLDLANRAPRLKTLVKQPNLRAPFALMEITTEKPYDFYHYREYKGTVLGKPIYAMEDGTPHIIYPQVRLLSDEGMGLKWGFREPGTYYVMGEVTGGTYQTRGEGLIRSYLTMRVMDSRQIMHVNKENPNDPFYRPHAGERSPQRSPVAP